MTVGLRKQALACCAVLLCTGLVLADGPAQTMRATVIDNQGEFLTQATVVAHIDGVSEPVRGEPVGDGTWLIPGLGAKNTLVVKDPVRGTASVDLSLPEASGGAVVNIYWGEKGAEVRVVALLPEPTPAGLRFIPSISPSPLEVGGSRTDTCPGDALFGQAPTGETGSWSFATSGDTTSFTYKVYEDFSGVGGDICNIHWWGLVLAYDPAVGWGACADPYGLTYDIVFYADAGGAPGAVQCQHLGVTPTVSGTGLYYSGFEMLYMELDLDPCCSLSDGWVSIQSQANANDCTLLWASSDYGNGDSLQEDMDDVLGPLSTGYDRGLCLTGVYVPTYGACCDDSTSTCTDDVEMQDCLPPLRFAANTLCADLDPACGDVTTCDHTIVLTDDYGDGWNGGSVTVNVNTVAVLTVTLASGAGPETHVFQADTGDSIDTVYTAGSWPYENEYHVYDVNGSEICASGVGGVEPTGGFCGYGNCGADPCEGNEPVNDECVDATPVAGPYPQTVSGTNYCATVDCPGVLDWKATWVAIDLPNAVNNLTVSFCGNGFEINNVGVVYYNACNDCPNYVLYNAIDWYSCSDGITSPVISFDMIPGPTTVYFPVYFNDGLGAPYTIEIDVVGLVVPDNDLCDIAEPVAVPSTTPGTTQGASIDSDAPYCGTSITAPGVWYSVIGTGNTMTASLCSADWDTKMCVYCVECKDLLCVDGNDDACGVQSEVTWCSQLGAEYFVLVHGYSSNTGPFDLDVYDDGTPCSGGVKCLPEGACCLLTGECVITTQIGCDAAGGDYHGDDTTCGVGTLGDEAEARLDCSDYILDTFDSSSPIWNRSYGAYTPDLNCNASMSDSGADGQYYAAYPITVSAVENLDIEVLSADFDTTMHVYCDPFDPANPLDNVVAYDDDGGVGALSAFFPSDGIQLNVGETYYLVLSSFSGGYTGDFEICLRGTATVGGGGPGACCFPDGSCAEMEAADCSDAGGIFGGAGTDCATYECPEFPGACCLPDGSCIVTIESCCVYAGGVFVGSGTDCGTGTVVLFSEDFNAGIPGDWAITDDDGGGLMWNTNVYWGDGNYTGGSGDCAEASSDAYGSSSYDTSLISPNLDLSAAVSATLDFECDFQNYAYYDWFYVDVSYDKGTNWTNLLTWNEDHTAEHVTLPIAGGSADTIIRFRYYDPVDHWNWQVQIDDVVVTAEVEGLSPCQSMDIKPGSCPNSYNRNSHGVLPVALVGTEDFDAGMVDISSLLLSRADGVGGSVAPHEGPPGPHTVIDDVATAFGGIPCDCHELTGDGIDDVKMKFKTDEVVPALELLGEDPGALIELVLSGYLIDGTPFVASDCVRLVPPGSGNGQMNVGSNVQEAWINITPLDNQLDGGGFTSFTRTYPVDSVVTLTAEAGFQGTPFLAWKINGVTQGHGQRSIQVTVTEGVQTIEFEALYLRVQVGDVKTPTGSKKNTGTAPLP